MYAMLHSFIRLSCDDVEERQSRKALRRCFRLPSCKGCTYCVCVGCETCRFSDCSCQTCIDFTRNADIWNSIHGASKLLSSIYGAIICQDIFSLCVSYLLETLVLKLLETCLIFEAFKDMLDIPGRGTLLGLLRTCASRIVDSIY